MYRPTHRRKRRDLWKIAIMVIELLTTLASLTDVALEIARRTGL
jgi:hypothetical protein